MKKEEKTFPVWPCVTQERRYGKKDRIVYYIVCKFLETIKFMHYIFVVVKLL